MEAMAGAAEEFADEYLKELPVGCRFRPTDEVLVVHYLKNKVLNNPMPLHAIRTRNIYRSHPSEFCGGDNVMRVNERYFFTPRGRKYPNGTRADRKAGDGFWKANGKEIPIKSRGALVGFKNTLVYYEGNPKDKPVKTNWLMQEYRLNPEIIPSTTAPDDNNKILDKCVLAKIYHNWNRKASPFHDNGKRLQIPKPEAVKDHNEVGAYFEEQPKGLQFPAPPQETLYPRPPEVAAPPPQPYPPPMPAASAATYRGGNNNVMNREVASFQSGSMQQTDQYSYCHQPFSFQVAPPPPYPPPMPAASAATYHGGNNNVMNREVASFQSGSMPQTDQYSYCHQPFSFQVAPPPPPPPPYCYRQTIPPFGEYCYSDQPSFQVKDNGFWNSLHGGLEDYCYNALPAAATSIRIADIEEMVFGPAGASTDQNSMAASTATQAETDDHPGDSQSFLHTTQE